MSPCCAVNRNQKTSVRKRLRAVCAWALPSALLLLVPKCPACLAAYVVIWTGFGLSFSTAAYLRWTMLIACVASLLFLAARQLRRQQTLLIDDDFPNQETTRCNTP